MPKKTTSIKINSNQKKISGSLFAKKIKLPPKTKVKVGGTISGKLNMSNQLIKKKVTLKAGQTINGRIKKK